MNPLEMYEEMTKVGLGSEVKILVMSPIANIDLKSLLIDSVIIGEDDSTDEWIVESKQTGGRIRVSKDQRKQNSFNKIRMDYAMFKNEVEAKEWIDRKKVTIAIINKLNKGITSMSTLERISDMIGIAK